MSRSLLPDQNYAYAEQGYLVDNMPWQDEIRKRLEAERAPKLLDPMPTLNPAEFEPLMLPENPEASEVQAALEPSAEEVAEKLKLEAEEKAKSIEQTARKSAYDLVEQARWEAQDLIQKAKEEAEKEVQALKDHAAIEGRHEGMEAGKLEGIEMGRQEGQKAYFEAIQKWSGMMEATLEQRHQLLGEMQPLLVDLVGQALYQCLKRKAEGDNQMIVEMVGEALRKAQDRVHLKLHLNPADVEEVKSQSERLSLSVGAGHLELVPDARIERGGCVLETEAGSVDARLATMVSQAKDALTQGMPAR
ncbi:MAG TPA: FliH/SctL family protein [bacterium]|nr:FliH/SctL family protein [bacterium]